MYHSIIISGRNTFTEWGMVPTSRPVINPPEVKTTYVDLPSSNGVLDYSDLLLGSVPYGQREGSWEFVLRPGRTWATVYSSIMNFLHGQRHTVILEDDPAFLYSGRLSVNTWKSDPQYSLITIDYNLDPFKQSIVSSDENDWLWDDLFDLTIRYGSFIVEGIKYRNFINEGMEAATPTFLCSSAMSVLFNGQTYTLVSGSNYNANLTLQPGDNIMRFSGNGSVVVSYREVSL